MSEEKSVLEDKEITKIICDTIEVQTIWDDGLQKIRFFICSISTPRKVAFCNSIDNPQEVRELIEMLKSKLRDMENVQLHDKMMKERNALGNPTIQYEFKK